MISGTMHSSLIWITYHIFAWIYLDRQVRANSVEPDQMLQNVAANQCAHCLSLVQQFITKTRLYNFDPLKPDFHIVKLGFTGVYIIFLILLKKQIVDTH